MEHFLNGLFIEMNILIAGAGIGGLTAALCLQKTGHQVQLLEQAPEFTEVGAGIQCGANALRVLDYLGLNAEIEAVAVDPLRADFREHKTGAVLHSLPFGQDYARRHGALTSMCIVPTCIKYSLMLLTNEQPTQWRLMRQWSATVSGVIR